MLKLSNAFNQKRIEKNLISIAQNEYLSVLIITLWKKENFGKEKIWDFLEKINAFDKSYSNGAENLKKINSLLKILKISSEIFKSLSLISLAALFVNVTAKILFT